MRRHLPLALVLATVLSAIVAVAAAQTTTTATSAKKIGGRSITLTGCVTPDTANAGHFTLADFTSGAITYRLSGSDVRKYLGRRVELVGAAVEPKLKIVGGLTPSPNIAGQAGAIDPTRAAMAAQGAEGNARPGNIEVPELRVKTVRAVAGGCVQ